MGINAMKEKKKKKKKKKKEDIDMWLEIEPRVLENQVRQGYRCQLHACTKAPAPTHMLNPY